MLNFIFLGFEFFVYFMLWFFGLFLRYRYLVKVFFVIKVRGFFLGVREIIIDWDMESRIMLDI